MMKLRSTGVFLASILACVIALGLLPAPVMAKATTIKYGDTVTGTIVSDADATQFQFAAKAGDTVSITVTSVDTTQSIYLYLNDTNGNQMANAGGVHGENTATIQNFYLFADGKYGIDVRGIANEDFSLTVERQSEAKDRAVVFE